jgi:tetratricopeptide (TPR) repeat protein
MVPSSIAEQQLQQQHNKVVLHENLDPSDDVFTRIVQQSNVRFHSSSSGRVQSPISTARLKRCFRTIQTVKKHVAIHALMSIHDNDLFNECRDEFVEWKILSTVELLRSIFDDQPVERAAKRQKREDNNNNNNSEDENGGIDKIRLLLDTYLQYIQNEETTSYDDMVEAVLESFCYHPTKSLELFHSALAKNRFHYYIYLHAMEPYRQSGQKLDCVKSLRYAKYLAESEAEDAQAELDAIEQEEIAASPFLIQIITQDVNELKAAAKVFEGLIHFFSDGSTEDMFKEFTEAIEYDPKSIYAYCNLGVLNAFNIHGSRDTCQIGIRLLEKALQCCTVKEHPVISSFLHHTIAQTYMRMNCIEEALKNIDQSLEYNPLMILAFFDRSSIFRNTNNLQGALEDNDVMIKMQPETPFELSNIYCNRAVLHYKLNQQQEMYDALYKSVAIDPSNSFSYIMLSKQAILRNDYETFEQLRGSVQLRDHIHVTHYLQHLKEGYTHFGKTDKVQQVEQYLAYYSGAYFRID